MTGEGREWTPVEALVADLRKMHRGHVNNVHPGTHHNRERRRNLFSGCSCGWNGQDRIAHDYDASVPMPCPTVRRLDLFVTENASSHPGGRP